MGGVSGYIPLFGKDPSKVADEIQQQAIAKHAPPPPPDAADEAVQAARTFERRRQLGLQGRMSTFLQTAQGESSGGAGDTNAPTTILGA